MILVLA